MTALLEQIKGIASGDLVSNAGIFAQIGNIFLTDGYEIAGVKIDLIIDEAHESAVTATSYPIEFGANITDHIYANPDSITISGIISDIEIGKFFDIGVLGLAAKVKGLAGGDTATKSSMSWKKLKEIQRAGQLISVVTNLCEYKNMAIISMSCKQDKNSNTEVRFMMTLRELFIVGSQRYKGDITKLSGTTKSKEKGKGETSKAENNQRTSDRLEPKTNNGVQQGTQPPSWASTILNKVAGG